MLYASRGELSEYYPEASPRNTMSSSEYYLEASSQNVMSSVQYTRMFVVSLKNTLKLKFESDEMQFVCAFSHTLVIFKHAWKFSKACGATKERKEFKGGARGLGSTICRFLLHLGTCSKYTVPKVAKLDLQEHSAKVAWKGGQMDSPTSKTIF